MVSKGVAAAPRILHLEKPNALLLASGFPDLPIELRGEDLDRKTSKHSFDAIEITDLPKALNNPLAVFNSSTNTKNTLVFTEIKKGNNNFIVAIELSKSIGGRLFINEIRSVYPRENSQIITAINKSEGIYYNEKMLDWLNAQLFDATQKDSNSIDRTNANKHDANIQQKIQDARNNVKNHQNPITDTEIRFAKEEAIREQQENDNSLQTITQSAFENLISILKKPFAKAFSNLNVTIDWNEFTKQAKALKGFKDLDSAAFYQKLSNINNAFNEQLQQLIDKKLPQGHIFQLGTPNAILQASGIPNLPIELSAKTLEKKSSDDYKKKHPFDKSSIKDIVKAIQNPIQNPIAVFNNPNNDGKVILTELQHNGVNHIVVLKVRTEQGKNEIEIETNSVITVFPKDRIEEIAGWINDNTQGRKVYLNKEKALVWLSNNRTTLHSKGFDTKDLAKVIQNFKNPISDSEINDAQFQVEPDTRKQKQLALINKSNPAPNNYNTWVRSEKDILTAEEAFSNAFQDGEMYPDFTIKDMQKALDSGEVTIYSSKPIKEGVFVTPSKMNAESYSGNGKIFSKVVKTTDLAWIDEGEGQFAPVQFMRTPTGIIYGAKLPDGTIYINPNKLNANTPIHEFSHLWEQIMPLAWEKGLAIFKETAIGKKLFAKLKEQNNYEQLSEEQLWSEAMNTHIGNIGEKQYLNPKGKMAEFVDWFKTTMAKFLKAVNVNINFTKETDLKQFTNKVLGDLLGGKELTSEADQSTNSDIQFSNRVW